MSDARCAGRGTAQVKRRISQERAAREAALVEARAHAAAEAVAHSELEGAQSAISDIQAAEGVSL